ncbi:hypothetical protein BDF20DRAFT_328580 [Mycotypha africana]|uniref:uncharacterized protein n=1 Tax=Mycotypha africana TaxID=64632 RepID=UPI002301CC81|nr:uncharacterized protein BDF20DRAFT_328580 [Mycotypha africana]KAI8988371.1 hypothetical protein BDF20DRAFT_328580 [Mycotypha africana]
MILLFNASRFVYKLAKNSVLFINAFVHLFILLFMYLTIVINRSRQSPDQILRNLVIALCVCFYLSSIFLIGYLFKKLRMWFHTHKSYRTNCSFHFALGLISRHFKAIFLIPTFRYQNLDRRHEKTLFYFKLLQVQHLQPIAHYVIVDSPTFITGST